MRNSILALFVGMIIGTAPLVALDNWSQPQALSGFGALQVDLALDNNGNAQSIWSQTLPTPGAINAAFKTLGGNWAPETVDNLTSSFNARVITPQVAFDPQGNCFAIWSDSQGGNNYIVKAAQKPFGGTWQLFPQLSSFSFGTVLNVVSTTQIAVDPFSNVQAVWVDRPLTKFEIMGSVKLKNQSAFGPNSLISDPTQDSQDPQFAVDSQGNAVAIWTQSVVGGTAIRANEKPFNQPNWISSNIEIVSSGPNDNFPQVVFDADGNAIAAWITLSGTNRVINSSIKPVGSSIWGAPIQLSGHIPNNNFIFDMSVDPHGNVYIIWAEIGPTPPIARILVRTLPNGQTWQNPVLITDQALNGSNPNIAVDSNGNATAIWYVYDTVSKQGEIQVAQKLNNANWSAPGNLTSFSFVTVPPSFLPQVAADSFGNVTALWREQIGAAFQTWTSTFTFPVLSPSQLLVTRKKNDFGTMYEYYNRLEWSASTSTDVTGYIVYRDGVQIAQVGSDELKYKDHNRKVHETVTYGVATVNANGLISVPTTVTFVR